MESPLAYPDKTVAPDASAATITRPFRALGGLARRMLQRCGAPTTGGYPQRARRLRLSELLSRAFCVGGCQYHEQFTLQQRGRGLPPTPNTMRIITADAERVEARRAPGYQGESEQSLLAWWWRRVESGKRYRMYRGRVRRVETEEEGGWQEPCPTRKQARRDARASTCTPADQHVGLFAQ